MSRRDNLPRPLPDAALAYLDALPPGRIVGFPITALDRTGVPVWVVALFLDESLGLIGAQPSGIGYGATDAQAIVGALGEIAEAIFPTLALQQRPKTHGSYDALVACVGANSIVDPLTCCLPAGSPVDHTTLLDWSEATRFETGEPVLIPIDLAASDWFELSPGYQPFTTMITNGLGAGPDVDWAVGHGVLELLQRDGNGLVFRALDQGILLDPARSFATLRMTGYSAAACCMPCRRVIPSPMACSMVMNTAPSSISFWINSSSIIMRWPRPMTCGWKV